MRIISPFKDYYDCMQSTDQDRETLYIRKPKEEALEAWRFLPLKQGYSGYRGDSPSDHCRYKRVFAIGFCGVVRYALSFESDVTHPPDSGKGPEIKTVYAYSLADVDTHVAKLSAGVQRYYASERKQYKRRGWTRRTDPMYCDGRRESYARFFEAAAADAGNHAQMFESGCPIFVASCRYAYDRHGAGRGVAGPRIVAESGELTWHAQLPPGFVRLVPPAEAYQQLTVFIYNQALPIKEAPPLDDKTMAEIKGFDKYSFRKDPIKPRR